MGKQVRTITIDFDGVLHKYDGYKGGLIQGPIDGAREAVEKMLARGHTVVVFSTRDPTIISAWLTANNFPPLEVTSTKRPFWVIIDDRAIAFEGQWDKDLLHRIEHFEPYWVKARRAG